MAGIYLWFCFLKLPATPLRGGLAQSWEAVLSFAAAQNLGFGQEIVFTYGPLGFLTVDHYWGDHFWPILLWAFTFALVLAVLFHRLSRSLLWPVRLVLYVALPLLSVSPSLGLGFDAIYLFGIAAVGVLCSQKPDLPRTWLGCAGLFLGTLALIKFTFCLFAAFALVVLLAAALADQHERPRRIRYFLWLGGGAVAVFCTWWWLLRQSFSALSAYFTNSLRISLGYSDAMGTSSLSVVLLLGVLSLCGLAGLFVAFLRPSGKWLEVAPAVGIVAAGLFLAWKEGFVRADPGPGMSHVIVFVGFAFLVAGCLPALLRVAAAEQSRWLPLTVLTLVLTGALAIPFYGYWRGAVSALPARLSDAFTAVSAPRVFRDRLALELQGRIEAVRLPFIQQCVGRASIGCLFWDQDVALLNGLDYRPHPVFQNYSAYTPELQMLNAAFFNSTRRPDYLLWRYSTLDRRFPTVDEGSSLLRILSSYSPLGAEKEFSLWMLQPEPPRPYATIPTGERSILLDEWFPLPREATWLQVELKDTWRGRVTRLLLRTPRVDLEVKLEDGSVFTSRLVPGSARAGFLLNPLLLTEADLIHLYESPSTRRYAVAARIRTEQPACFKPSSRVVFSRVEGVEPLEEGEREN